MCICVYICAQARMLTINSLAQFVISKKKKEQKTIWRIQMRRWKTVHAIITIIITTIILFAYKLNSTKEPMDSLQRPTRLNEQTNNWVVYE